MLYTIKPLEWRTLGDTERADGINGYSYEIEHDFNGVEVVIRRHGEEKSRTRGKARGAAVFVAQSHHDSRVRRYLQA